jgi:hypothetical protein
MKLCRLAPLILVIAILALPSSAKAQSSAMAADSYEPAASAVTPAIDPPYTRPTEAIKLRNYAFNTFGPYPVTGAASVAAIGQMDNTPKEWQRGAAGYGRRFGSDFGIAGVSTTTRYALAGAFKEDTLYYRCECRGVFPRLRHAVISSLTARHGEDGHRAFSSSAIVSPYVGTATAVYAWYPSNYGARSALRMGNYNLLGNVGESILLEFFYSGPRSLRSRMHLNDRRAAPDPESK